MRLSVLSRMLGQEQHCGCCLCLGLEPPRIALDGDKPEGYMYAFQYGDFVKLGYSQNPAVRIRSLTASGEHPYRNNRGLAAKLEILIWGQYPASIREELALHRQLREWGQLIHQEWYRTGTPAIAVLEAVPWEPLVIYGGKQ
jgi:hypothetical protein